MRLLQVDEDFHAFHIELKVHFAQAFGGHALAQLPPVFGRA